MAKPPVLKPREVAAILQNLGFVEARQRGSHNNTDTQTDAARRFLFTLDETFLQSFCGKSLKILASRLRTL